MDNFVDFVGYMFFSSLEYFALILTVLCMFRFQLKYFIKEMVITTVIVTLVSYILLISNMTPFIMPINLIILVVIFRFFIVVTVDKNKAAKNFWIRVWRVIEKWLYPVWIIFAGTIAYTIIQFAIVLISMQSGVITAADLSQSYGWMTYLHQALIATITISIATWIKYTNGGFGFNFRTSFSKPLYTIIALISVLVWSVFFFLYASIEHHIYFYLLLGSVVSLFIVALSFSYLKEQEEFSYS